MIQSLIQEETLELLEWHRLCQHLSTFAATKLGSIAARQFPLPETKEESINLLSQTREIYELEQTADRLSFDGIHDIGEALERANLGGLLSGNELLKIATTLAGTRKLRRTIDQGEGLPVLKELVEEIRTYPEIEIEIHRCIDEDGRVADRASPTLREVRGQLKVVRERIYRKLQDIMQKQGGAIQETVITQRGDRFVIPVKAPQKDQIPGIIHDTSSTGATYYVEPAAIVEQGNKLRQYRKTEQLEEEKILRELSDKIATAFEDLEYLLARVTILDLATARARYSAWLEGNPPRFIEGETTTLRQLRHPLLVWQKHHEQGNEVVPINVQIAPSLKVIAITGPNTGGKTVTLKTIGLAALMAKFGLFVPAREPVEMPWFDRILADIGDEQSLQQSLSTFSGHIRRIVRILADLTPDSLVLLDEVGAGTDPAEGSPLAIAILQYLADRGGLTVATTHYGELKALKYQDSRFENASVEFDDRTLSPTYRLLWGIPGRSNALTIAGRLGLNPEIIEAARDKVGDDSEDVNRVIAGLEAQRREQEQKAKEASKLLTEAEKFYNEVSQRANSLQERERELKRYQEQEVQKALLEAKGEIAAVIRRLQAGPATGQDARLATESLDNIGEKLLPKPPKPLSTYLPKVGEKIRLPNLGQTADVLEVVPESSEVVVRFGIMKMTLSMTEIESLDGKKVEVAPKPAAKTPPPPPPKNTPKNSPLVRTSNNTLDIRGFRVADAESDLETAINRATNEGTLWIVHGKGTGKLRQGVHEFLSRHPQVKRFELAPQNDGGSGVTIAYLS